MVLEAEGQCVSAEAVVVAEGIFWKEKEQRRGDAKGRTEEEEGFL